MTKKSETRTIQGAQFSMTTPSDWRKTHGLEKGSLLNIFYQPNSVLVVNPASRALTPFEEQLIKILVNLPSSSDVQVAVGEIKDLITKIEGTQQ